MTWPRAQYKNSLNLSQVIQIPPKLHSQFNSAAGLFSYLQELTFDLATSETEPRVIADKIVRLNSAALKLFAATYNNSMLVNLDIDDVVGQTNSLVISEKF